MRSVAMKALLASALVMGVAPAAAQTSGEVRMSESRDPLLTFSITETMRRAPDRASVGAGVTTQAPTAVEAMRQNAERMAQVVRTLRARGVPERDIQTSGINLSAQYDHTPTQRGEPPRFTGYQVTNQVRVRTADITNLGRLLDALVEAGGNNLDGPDFYLDQPEEGLASLRASAMRKAEARAAEYARLAGARGARLVSVTEGGGYARPMPYAADAIAVTASRVEATPVSPGQVQSNLLLTFQYRLER